MNAVVEHNIGIHIGIEGTFKRQGKGTIRVLWTHFVTPVIVFFFSVKYFVRDLLTSGRNGGREPGGEGSEGVFIVYTWYLISYIWLSRYLRKLSLRVKTSDVVTGLLTDIYKAGTLPYILRGYALGRSRDM